MGRMIQEEVIMTRVCVCFHLINSPGLDPLIIGLHKGLQVEVSHGFRRGARANPH